MSIEFFYKKLKILKKFWNYTSYYSVEGENFENSDKNSENSILIPKIKNNYNKYQKNYR